MNTQAKHTPGPWRAVLDIQPGRPDRWLVRGPDRGLICETFGLEDRADAHLIASGPELLAALRLLLTSEMPTDPMQAKIESGKRDIARAAIAKAEGRK